MKEDKTNMALPLLFLGAGLGWIAERTFGSAPTRGENETLRQKLASSQAQISHLQSIDGQEVEQLRTQLASAQALVVELQSKQQAEEGQIAQLSEKLQGAEAQISELQAAADVSAQQLTDAQAKIGEMNAAAEASAQQLASAQAQIGEMSAAADLSAQQLTDAQAQISQMQVSSQDAKLARVSQMQAAQQAAEQLQHELGNARAQIKQLEANEEEANQLRQQMAAATAQISQMQADQEAAVQELAYASAQISQLEETSTERSLPEDNASDANEEEVKTLRQKLVDTESQIFNLQAKLDLLNNKNKIDDLEEIKGIGPTIEQRFYKAGIHSYAQLAQLTVEQVEEIALIKNKQRIESMLEQARDLTSQE